MNEYQGFYESRFVRNLTHYSGLRQRIQRRVEQILKDPYTGTGRLGRVRFAELPQCIMVGTLLRLPVKSEAFV